MPRPRMLSSILFVLIVIGIVYLGTGYLRARQQQQELAARLDDTARALALVPVPPSDMPRQLADAKQANSSARAFWPDSIDTTQVIKRVLDAADAVGVKAIPLTTDQWTTKTIKDANYNVLSIKVSFEGNLAALTALINRLYGSEFAVMGVDTVTVSAVNGQTLASGSTGGSVFGTLELAIFSRPVQ